MTTRLTMHSCWLYIAIDQLAERAVRSLLGDSYGYDYSSDNEAALYARLFRATSNLGVIAREAVAEERV